MLSINIGSGEPVYILTHNYADSVVYIIFNFTLAEIEINCKKTTKIRCVAMGVAQSVSLPLRRRKNCCKIRIKKRFYKNDASFPQVHSVSYPSDALQIGYLFISGRLQIEV